MNRNIRANKGFTLLEILLVIAAIGILAAIVLVAINPNRQIAQVRNAQRRSDINTIYKALEQYLIDNKDYPEGITGTPKAICNNTVTPDCVDLEVLVPTYLAEIPTDPSGGVYEVYINSENNRIAVESKDAELNQGIVINPIAAQINNITCPNNYILVPGSSLYGTTDFCVMKYEAKAVETSDPTVGLTTPTTGFNTIANNITPTTSAINPPRAVASVASGYPIANISQTTAIDYCANQNTVSGASLITNAEWMTIARNIEGQSSNWYNPNPTPVNQVGNGGLWRGHSDSSPNNALEASTNDNLGYIGTENDINNGWQEKRTHTLSNGEVIWDLSGNLWEWTNDIISESNSPSGGIQGLNTTQFTSITSYGDLSYDLVRPSDPSWNSSQNMGSLLSYGNSNSITNYAIERGSDWSPGGATAYPGIFGMAIWRTISSTSYAVGFRCVIR